MEKAELNKVLTDYKLWLEEKSNGICANLRNADFRNANLYNADLRSANFPSPTMLLLANWREVSDNLCIKLMRYDAKNCPKGNKVFDNWVKTDICPYDGIKWQRCANFRENKFLWSPGRTDSALKLAVALLKEKCTY